MAASAVASCLAGASGCHHRPWSQVCAASGPRSAGAIPLRSCWLGFKQRALRSAAVARRSRPAGPRGDAETEGNGRAGGLEELDNQLQSLSEPDRAPFRREQASNGGVEEVSRREGEQEKVEWPVFGEGFMLYVSGGLILLTIINNILFRVFIGPPVPRKPLFQKTESGEQAPSDGARRVRYRLRSLSDPKYLQQRSAPSPDTVGTPPS